MSCEEKKKIGSLSAIVTVKGLMESGLYYHIQNTISPIYTNLVF